jgi:hypothetical protein
MCKSDKLTKQQVLEDLATALKKLNSWGDQGSRLTGGVEQPAEQPEIAGEPQYTHDEKQEANDWSAAIAAVRATLDDVAKTLLSPGDMRRLTTGLLVELSAMADAANASISYGRLTVRPKNGNGIVRVYMDDLEMCIDITHWMSLLGRSIIVDRGRHSVNARTGARGHAMSLQKRDSGE